jgi:hypothetical protein
MKNYRSSIPKAAQDRVASDHEVQAAIAETAAL